MSNIETKFSIEDGMAVMDSIFDEPSEDSERKIERVKLLLGKLPMKEADFLELFYFKNKSQIDISLIYNCSQPTVHYRLNRAAARIKFMMHLPDIEEKELRPYLRKVLKDPIDTDIMIAMYVNNSQSVCSKLFKMSQGKIRHRFLRSIVKLWAYAGFSKEGLDHQEAYKKICDINEAGTENILAGLVVELFEAVSQNLNLLREVKRTGAEDDIRYHID